MYENEMPASTDTCCYYAYTLVGWNDSFSSHFKCFRLRCYFLQPTCSIATLQHREQYANITMVITATGIAAAAKTTESRNREWKKANTKYEPDTAYRR